MISFPHVFFSNSENSWTKYSGSYYCFSLNLVYLVFFVRGIGHTLTQGSWKQRAIRGKLNASKKHNYPECAASLVMRGGPHDISHVVNGFSGTRYNPHFFLFCQVGTLSYILLEIYAFHIYFQSVSHSEQALRYSSEKDGDTKDRQKLQRNARDNGKGHHEQRHEYESEKNTESFMKLQWL